jgi:hypothetical protein
MTRGWCLLALLLVFGDCGCGSGRSAASAHAPVPWVNRPRPRFTIPQPKLVRYPTTAQPCRPSQLRVSSGRGGVATGNALEELVFTNTSGRPCLLRGRPTVTGEAASGERRVLKPRPGTFFGELVPADLEPGKHVFLDFGTSDCGCHCLQPHPVRYRNLVFRLPQGGRVATSVSIVVDCFLDISSFGLPVRYDEPRARTGTVGSLRARISAPRTARAGATLSYIVTLWNPTDAAILLRPCPGYTDATGRSFALNCDTVHAISPHGHVRYAMRLPIPEQDARIGVAKVVWRLNTPTGPSAATAVRVTGG